MCIRDSAYDIVIGRGLIASLGERIAALRPGAKVAVVTDATVAKCHLAATEAALKSAGIESSAIVVPEGEGSKSYATFETVCEAIVAAHIERGDLVVALGGGVIGDLAGFAAASARRGLDFVQVPTTLLAQVDSSVGGKTGINSRHGKNLVGAFHQPIPVVADTAMIKKLPKREFRARKGLVGEADAARARAHLAAVGLPTQLKDVPGGVPGIDALMDLIAQDKKVKRGKLTFILVRGIGAAFVENDVSAAEVRAFLTDKLNA